MAGTDRMNYAKTDRMLGAANIQQQIVNEEFSFTDAVTGLHIRVFPNLIGGGGESQIYEATESERGIKCIAKIDISGVLDDPVSKAHRVKTIAFLRDHMDYRRSFILPLLASQNMRFTQSNGSSADYPVDIFPFCEQGDLESCKLPPEQLRTQFIPGILSAIEEIHRAGLLHRDIKPNNIFIFRDTFVLGDFGTATYVGDQTSHFTSHFRGTSGYRAPEFSLKIVKGSQGAEVTAKSDYFAFGFTVATLLLGNHPCQHSLHNDVAFDHLLQDADAEGISLGLSKEHEQFQWLFTGLTRYFQKERCDGEGVRLWLHDPQAFYQKYIAGIQRTSRSGWARPFTVLNTVCSNERELGLALAENWNEAKKCLYREQLYDHFKDINQALANRLRDITDARATSTSGNQDLGLAQAIHYILGGGNICWQGMQFEDIHEIASNMERERAGAFNDAILKLLQSGYLSWKYQQIGDSSTAHSLQEIEVLSQRYPHVAYSYALHAWRFLKRKADKLKTADACFAAWFEGKNADQLSDSQWGWLAAVTNQLQKARQFRDNTDGHAADRRSKELYIFFYDLCSNKKIVVDHYFRFSADAWLPWFQSNLQLYDFNTPQARELRSELQAISLRYDLPMHEIQANCEKLRRKLDEFQKLFQGDYLLACLGMTKGLDRHGEITASKADAYFLEEDSFGQKVPLGYIKSLG